MVRTLALVAAPVLALVAIPAEAQFYLKAKEFTGQRVRGDEAGIIGQPMPGATPAELRAGVSWTMRAALNVAALQCQFEPTLLTVQNYNAILADHRDELDTSFDTLDKYFVRTAGSKAAGQKALDQFGTRTYSSFATVAAQYNFCRTAGIIGGDAITRPRGTFGDLSLDRIQELRNSLTPFGEQQFARPYPPAASLPRWNKECWKKDDYRLDVCGFGPPVRTTVASAN